MGRGDEEGEEKRMTEVSGTKRLKAKEMQKD